MPCSDGGPSWEQVKAEERKVKEEFERKKNIEATLCGAFSLLSKLKLKGNFIDLLDYKEMGVSKEWVSKWWKEHQEEDRQRIAREQAERKSREDRLRRQHEAEKLKNSLTPEQKRLLKEFGV